MLWSTRFEMQDFRDCMPTYTTFPQHRFGSGCLRLPFCCDAYGARFAYFKLVPSLCLSVCRSLLTGSLSWDRAGSLFRRKIFLKWQTLEQPLFDITLHLFLLLQLADFFCLHSPVLFQSGLHTHTTPIYCTSPCERFKETPPEQNQQSETFTVPSLSTLISSVYKTLILL